MRIALLLFLTALSSANPSFGQSVAVSRRPVTYTRKRSQVDHKKTFKITYPVIKAGVPAVSAKIMAQLDYFKLFDFNLAEELGEMHWLEDADFDVKLNDRGISSVAMWIEGSAAYPDGVTKYVNVDSTKGTPLTSVDLFINRGKLSADIDKKMQKAIQDAIVAMKADKENSDLDPGEMFAEHKYTLRMLKSFYVTKEGVTFIYDFGFPHAIQALEPDNEYLLTWSELKPFIKPDGLLAGFVR